jgi:hypothetical protein
MLHDLHSVPIAREHLGKASHLRNSGRVAGLACSERPEKSRATKQPQNGCAQFFIAELFI